MNESHTSTTVEEDDEAFYTEDDGMYYTVYLYTVTPLVEVPVTVDGKDYIAYLPSENIGLCNSVASFYKK